MKPSFYSVGVFIILCYSNSIISAQSVPEPHILAVSSYSFTEWADSMPAATYPPNMFFHQTDLLDPPLEYEMKSDWNAAYNLTSKSRINGAGKDGISFINTASAQDGGGWVGAAVVALDTRNCSRIKAIWTGRTYTSNDRKYAIALQYKIGVDGAYIDLNSIYPTADAGSSYSMDTLTLPAETENQPLVLLRWKYYYVEGNSGQRSKLGLDDIYIFADSINTSYVEEANQELIIVDTYVNRSQLIILFEKNSGRDCPVEASLYNCIGESALAKRRIEPSSASEAFMDISKLNRGIYFLVLESDKSIAVRKILL